MTVQKQYENAKIIGVYVQSAWAGLACYGYEFGIEDSAIIAFVYKGAQTSPKRKYKIYESSKGYYIVWRNRRHYLSDFLRVDNEG